MRVTEPLPITAQRLAHSSIAEPAPGEPALWVPGQAYAVGQRVTRAETHRIYTRVKDEGDNNALPESPEAAALWHDDGPTARWSMFALDRNTASASSDPITVRLAPGQRVTTLGLFGVRGQQVDVTVRHGGQVLYQHQARMYRRHTASWSGYFFGGFDTAQVPSLLRYDLPPVIGAEVEITVSGGAGPFAVAACVLGQSHHIGHVKYNAQSDALDFSRIERRPDGTAILLRRRNVPRLDLPVHARADQVPLLYALRERLMGRVAIWSGLDDKTPHPYFEPLLALGFLRRWLIDLAHPRDVSQSIEIEEF